MSLMHLAALLRLNIMAHRKLDDWLDHPHGYSRVDPPDEPLPLFANIPESIGGRHEMKPGPATG